MSADQAVETLKFTNKRAAFLVHRVLASAMANANEKEAKMNKLFVSDARVDGGPIIKRFQPKDRGRAHAIQKKTSHIVIGVAERA
jgi:large subunit ribosomal protein L22